MMWRVSPLMPDRRQIKDLGFRSYVRLISEISNVDLLCDRALSRVRVCAVAVAGLSYLSEC